MNRACNGTVPALSHCAINTRALISYGREGDKLEVVLNGSKGSQSAVAQWLHGRDEELQISFLKL